MENQKPKNKVKEIADYCIRYAAGFGVSYGTFYLLGASSEQSLVGAAILGAITPAWKLNSKRLEKKYGLEQKL